MPSKKTLRQTQGNKKEPSISDVLTGIESLSNKFDTLSVRVEGLSNKFDYLSGRIDGLSGQVNTLTGRVDSLSDRVNILTGRVNTLTKRVDSLTGRVNTLSGRMDTLSERLDDTLMAVNEFSTDTEKRFKRIDKRLNKIEATMVTKDYLDKKLGSLRGDLTVVIRKGDKKLKTLTRTLHQRKVISQTNKRKIFSMEPFPEVQLQK